MAFVRFNPEEEVPDYGAPTIKFHKGGFYINKALARELGARKFENAELFWETERKLAAFKITNAKFKPTDGIVRMSGQYGDDEDSARSVNSSSFAKRACTEGKYAMGKRYHVQKEGDMIVILWSPEARP